MIESDREQLYGVLAGVFELYGKKASPELFDLYYSALEAHDLIDIIRALNLHSVDPDQGQFCPKPADVVRYIAGSKQTRALQAWTKVENAVRKVGGYATVVFDDPTIHAVLEEMGGWIDLCSTPNEKDFEFKGHEFSKRYQGIVLQGGPEEYPSKLIGMIEADTNRCKRAPPLPVLIGSPEGAQRVLELGGDPGSRLTITSDTTRSIQKLLASRG